MRTRTTTREGTWNMEANYPLKMFLHERGWDDLVRKMNDIQYLAVVTDARTLTDDPERVEIISQYIKNGRDRDLRE
jgi:hypothetical protein